MKGGVLIVLTLVLGALAGHFFLEDNGYVLLRIAGYVVETSVPVALGILVLAYLLIRLLAWVWRVPRQLGEATARARLRWAGRQTTRGYIAIADGKLARGERLLTRGARRSGAPLMNYLAAARLAHQLNDATRRDGWLRLAFEQEPAATDAVLLAQAEMQMDDQAFDDALETLNRILKHKPKHAQALRLVATLHWQRKEWGELLDMLPTLRAMPSVPQAMLKRWTIDAFEARLADTALDRNGIDKLWEEIPRVLRRDPRLVLARAQALVRNDSALAAEAELRLALRDSWHAGLVRFYGELEIPQVPQHLKYAEAFLTEYPEDPDLLLTVGRLSLRNQLWGKARSYLEASQSIRPDAETCAVLGQLLDRIGEKEAAARAYQKGLEISIRGTEHAPQGTSVMTTTPEPEDG